MENTVYITQSVRNYSQPLMAMIKSIADEVKEGIKDGMALEFVKMKDNEAGLYDFVKNEGYDIEYKEFQIYVHDAKIMLDKNGAYLEELIEEEMTEEIKDDDLEKVTGGSFWQKHKKGILIGLGVACVVAAVAVAVVAAPVSFVAVGAATASLFEMSGIATIGGLALVEGAASFGLGTGAAIGGLLVGAGAAIGEAL